MKKLNKILITSNNPHKIEKLKNILQNFFEQIDTLQTIKIVEDIEETGTTFEENARIKALAFSDKYDGYVIATDGGVDIPALENWNSLFTRRFAGENVDDFFRLDTILQMMESKQGGDRRMIWREAVAVAYKDKIIHSETVDGIEGVMQNKYDKNKYKKGIWLCSLFFFPQFNKNFFDLDSHEVEQVEISWVRIGDVCKRIFSC